LSPSAVITLLGWTCYLGAAAAIAAYVLHFAGGRGFKRPWNAAGLFFSSIALSQTPFLFQDVTDPRGLRSAAIVTFSLVAGVAVQAYAALRQRRGTDDGPQGPIDTTTPGSAA
jgi:hypothetical protein